MLDWEGNGNVLNLCIDVASEAWTKVILLVTLVASLEAAKPSFMMCNREDTPALANYGEVLLCHYTKGFVFSFPAMATSVMLLLFGRDLLQKRFYYGLLKAGGVMSFSDNTAHKDPFFLAMCLDFCHCIGYTLFHLMVLRREGQESNLMRGFVPEASGTSTMPPNSTPSSDTSSTAAALVTLATTLLVKGAMMLLVGGPKLGGLKGGTGQGQTMLMLRKYLETIMVLVATFLETFLLIIFMYFAYDITGTLVPMSEYLDSYEESEENPMEYLHSFRDGIAKSILEHSPQIISNADGDIRKVYALIVENYLLHRKSFRNQLSLQTSPAGSGHASPRPEEPSSAREKVVAVLTNIGLIRSLWPAKLLLRRDIRGRDPKTFRRVWLVYAVLSIVWLLQNTVLLLAQAGWVVMRLWNKELEQLIPLSVILLHVAGVAITIAVFCESLAPLASTKALSVSDDGW